jgi:tRNA 5-methylaminomethyl-2-thiouridine biosynthesis bifunctional protein
VFTALGSRGITWAALGAQVIAAAISGAPSPVGTRLLDAIDPARFAMRRRQRQGR